MDTNVKNFLLYIDVSATETPSYEQVCPLEIGYDQGESLDTWNDLCSEMSNNVKLSIDPTWSVSFKFDKTDDAAKHIIGKEYAVGKAAVSKMRLVNLLKGTTGKQIDFLATLSNISYSVTPEEVLQIDFDIKVYKASTFAETDYSNSI